jgi:hypothetical protein
LLGDELRLLATRDGERARSTRGWDRPRENEPPAAREARKARR